jgi:3-oxoacyl-[acyl-carrier-protein] synthase II
VFARRPPARPAVAITGLGATTPLGGDVATSWDALLAGRSGIVRLNEPWAVGGPVRIAGRIKVEPSEVMDAAGLQVDRSVQFALIAAAEAWRDAGLEGGWVDGNRLGVVIGSAVGGVGPLLETFASRQATGPHAMSARSVLMLTPNSAAVEVGRRYGARAGLHAPAVECGSGAEAIGYGVEMIRAGRADIVLAGGTEATINKLTLSAFADAMEIARDHEVPEHASRPYDKARDGFVLGEGAGMVVLESAQHAAIREVRMYALLAGVGYRADPHSAARPDPSGRTIASAIKRAITDAGVSPDQVVHLNAHADSTRHGDVAELNGIRRALGAHADRVAISATKSMTGHLLGAAGGVETVFAVKALSELTAPPTINIDDLDDDITLDIVRDTPRTLPAQTAAGPSVVLNNAIDFDGHHVALALRRV